MLHAPVFTLTAIVVLMLSAAAISTVFTVTNTLLFQGLAGAKSANIVIVSATRNRGSSLGFVSYPDYVRFRNENQTLSQLVAHHSSEPFFVTTNTISQEVNGAIVTGNFFSSLGIKPELGRLFYEPEDSVPDRDRVAVISHALWSKWFSSSSDAIGKSIKINGIFFTIIGVAPPNFHGMENIPTEIYIPTMMLRVGYRNCTDTLMEENCTMLSMFGRLRDGRTMDEAKADMDRLVPERWRKALPGTNSGMTAFRLEGADRSETAFFLVKLLIVTSGVLTLVCCANVTGLLLVRGTARARELAIKTSLGAKRSRLVRQLLVESFLLGLFAGALGLLVSIGLTRALDSQFYSWDSEGHRLYFSFRLSSRLALNVLAVSVLASMAFGLVAALKSTQLGQLDIVKQGSGFVSGRLRLGQWLIGAQIAVSVGLVTNASLLVASARAVANGLNFEASHIVMMRVRPKLLNYPPDKAQQIQRKIYGRLENAPDVESVTLLSRGWAINGTATSSVGLDSPSPTAQNVIAGSMEVGPNYFNTLRIPLLGGREFELRDTVGFPLVAVVNESLARSLWPRGNAVGSSIFVDGVQRQVVGIAADIPLRRPRMPLTYVYMPYWQDPNVVDARYCIRVKSDPESVLARLVREVNEIDPDLPLGELFTLPMQVSGWFRPLRLTATFFSYTALVAILLSAVGTYGTFAFVTSRRSREMGIRLALGALPFDVCMTVVKQGLFIICWSIPFGVALAVIGVQMIRQLLVGLPSSNAQFYLISAVVVGCSGLLACFIPAYRISKVNPAVVLKAD
jgi:predicted permease